MLRYVFSKHVLFNTGQLLWSLILSVKRIIDPFNDCFDDVDD